MSLHALVFGFDYSARSVAAAVEALRESGAARISWMLHQNRLADYERQLGDYGIQLNSAAPQVGQQHSGGAWPAPLLSAEAEVDLRFLIHREGRYRHEWESSLALEQLRAHVYGLLLRLEPDVVVFSDVPHGAASYLLYRLAERFGIRRLVVRYGPTPLHVNVVDDIDARLLDVVSTNQVPVRSLSESSELYVQRLRGEYRTAEPGYSKASKSIGAVVRSKLHARSIPLDPQLIRGTYERQVLRSRYERRAVRHAEFNSLEGRVVVAYLHLQPERTTTPEGGRFAQQWLMIQALRARLPQDFTLLVREHPITFVRGPRLVRSRAFYDAVESLGGTRLLSVEVPSFDVADRASYVATVTGTVALEAAARGRPSIVFGNAPHRGCKGILDGDAPHWSASDGPDRAMSIGLPISDFLARFDSSSVTYVAPWDGALDARNIQESGVAFRELLPRALVALPRSAPMGDLAAPSGLD